MVRLLTECGSCGNRSCRRRRSGSGQKEKWLRRCSDGHSHTPTPRVRISRRRSASSRPKAVAWLVGPPMCGIVPRLAVAFQEGLAEFGRLDIIIANAGIVRLTPCADEERETLWRDIIDTNLTGVWNTVEVALPALREGGRRWVDRPHEFERGTEGDGIRSSRFAGLHGREAGARRPDADARESTCVRMDSREYHPTQGSYYE
jgi:hypothetical protein